MSKSSFSARMAALTALPFIVVAAGGLLMTLWSIFDGSSGLSLFWGSVAAVSLIVAVRLYSKKLAFFSYLVCSVLLAVPLIGFVFKPDSIQFGDGHSVGCVPLFAGLCLPNAAASWGDVLDFWLAVAVVACALLLYVVVLGFGARASSLNGGKVVGFGLSLLLLTVIGSCILSVFSVGGGHPLLPAGIVAVAVFSVLTVVGFLSSRPETVGDDEG